MFNIKVLEIKLLLLFFSPDENIYYFITYYFIITVPYFIDADT